MREFEAMRKIFACLAVLSLLFGSGCPKPKEPPPRSIQAIDDSVIATVKLNLKTDPDIAASNIDVSAENGLVALRGQVPSEDVKARAESIVKKSAKVEKVANHLEVSPP